MQMMFSDALPRRISVSKLIVSGIQTAPTKRLAAAKLAIKMLEFVCNCLTFFIVPITAMFKRTVNATSDSCDDNCELKGSFLRRVSDVLYIG